MLGPGGNSGQSSVTTVGQGPGPLFVATDVRLMVDSIVIRHGRCGRKAAILAASHGLLKCQATTVLERRSIVVRRHRATATIIPSEPQPHERDQLKDAGRHGLGKTVKVVKNGEGGSAREWNSATRNLYRTQRSR